jgi:hypothetical protein
MVDFLLNAAPLLLLIIPKFVVFGLGFLAGRGLRWLGIYVLFIVARDLRRANPIVGRLIYLIQRLKLALLIPVRFFGHY